MRELGCGVLMPEYRLTPKRRYPIPLDDCCDALACLRRRAGVKVWSETVPGAYHGFDGEMNRPLVQRLLARRVEMLRQMLQNAKNLRAKNT